MEQVSGIPQVYPMGDLSLGRFLMEGLAVFNSPETVHIRMETGRDGWTNGDRGKDSGNEEGGTKTEEGVNGEETGRGQEGNRSTDEETDGGRRPAGQHG
jgi:hypothetical protein